MEIRAPFPKSQSLASPDLRAVVKVCLSSQCAPQGGRRLYEMLKAGLPPTEALVLSSERCFGYCGDAPNIAVNDNIIRGVRPFLAVQKVRDELANPSCQADGLGGRSFDDLDRVLDDITKL